jgi:beta-glucosidase/6-phospho-beta-glucosidase/beta-galactosidase
LNKPRFFWGASTSSYQVEGGITENDWNYFTTSPSIKHRISIMTKPSIFYNGVTQSFINPAEDAVRFLLQNPWVLTLSVSV